MSASKIQPPAAKDSTKVRYGRATLTIRRAGGLIGDSPLTRRTADYRAGDASKEDVAWAFVRSRVSGHSPTFDWETADLARLLHLVAHTSSWPTFGDTDLSSVVERVVAESQQETEAQARLLEQVQSQFESTTELRQTRIDGAEARLEPHDRRQPESSARQAFSYWARFAAWAVAVFIGVPCVLFVLLYLVLMAIVGGKPF